MIDSTLIRLFNTVGVFALVLLAMVYLWLVEREQREALRVLFSVLIAGVAVVFLKELFLVPRPFVIDNSRALAGLAGSSSFPSFHSALAFSTATTVTFRRRGFGLLLILLAILVGVGRIVANVHYPLDVVVGIVIGVMIATFVHNMPIKLGRSGKRG